jgi:hypothetical protein
LPVVQDAFCPVCRSELAGLIGLAKSNQSDMPRNAAKSAFGAIHNWHVVVSAGIVFTSLGIALARVLPGQLTYIVALAMTLLILAPLEVMRRQGKLPGSKPNQGLGR